MSRLQTWWVGATLIVVLSLGAAACQPLRPARFGRTATGAYQDVMNVDERGNTTVDRANLATALAQIPTGVLSSEEVDGLLWMREEEKLAHDVYVTLNEQWNFPVFQHISQSEQTHTDAVKSLLERYNLADPAVGKDVGVFVNPTLQALYDQLVAQGGQSLAAALLVGATIEDLDIVDLQTRLAQTEKADIQLVYSNLMKGSRNHMRAFTQTLTSQTGQSYTPQYLDQAAYEAIINSPTERGQGHGR